MSILLFIFPIISVIIGIILLYKGTSSFLKKGENLYIYFRFLFSLIVIFLFHFILIGSVIWYQTNNIINLDTSNIFPNLILVGFPILGSSIGIGFVGKYIFEFIFFVISYGNKLNNTMRYLKMFIFLLLHVILLFIINSTIIYGLIIYFQMANLGITITSNLYIINSLLLGLSGFGQSIGIALLISGIFIYLKKLLSKENIKNGKKVLYSLGCFILFILLYYFINFGSLFSLIVSFQLLNIDSYLIIENLNIGLTLGITSLITGIIQGYYFFHYQKNNCKILVPISAFIISTISIVLALVYAFNKISLL